MKFHRIFLLILLPAMMIYHSCTKDERQMLVSTGNISNILTTSAYASGEILDLGEGVSQYGHCWSTSPNATIDDAKSTLGIPPGVGGFTSELKGLQPGTTYFIKAYCSRGNTTTYGKEINFTSASADIPELTTTEVTGITKTAAVSGGNITHQGGTPVTLRGVCWGTASNPTVDGAKTSNGSGPGNFAGSISGLSAGTTYYVRAYATNSGGTAYGNELNFTTDSDTPIAPIVTTGEVTSVTATSAVCGGEVTDEGSESVTVKGVCWSTSPNPTTTNNTTNDGNGIGSFVSNLPGLNPGTTYYIRAYAISSAGTSYGTEDSFLTSAVIPTLNTVPVTAITSNSANSGGDITGTGGLSILSKGVCWKTSSGPTINNNKTEDGIGTDDFVSTLVNLQPGTHYYVRAYATNSTGTGYGNEVEFTTYMPPDVIIGSASSVTKTSALLNGNINPNGRLTTVTFEYGLTTSYGNTVSATQSPINGTGLVAVSVGITGLTEGTEYHFRIKAESDGGIEISDDASFYTLKEPSANTYSATSISNTGARFMGEVNPNNHQTIVTFEYGKTTSYGMSVTASQSPVEGNTTTDVHADVNGLISGQVYHYRTKAVSSGGTAYGGDQLFTTTVKDADGNSYNMVVIGSQVWMKENLKTTKLNDGTAIDNVTDDYYWRDTYNTDPKYCWFVNNESAYKNTYGALYNGYAVNTDKLCPQGWHVPALLEWTSLISYLGGESVAGGKMKEVGLTHWSSINTGATNESGFTGLPGGYRLWDGSFGGIGFMAFFWRYMYYDYENKASVAYILNNNAANIEHLLYDWRYGFSVRCLRD